MSQTAYKWLPVIETDACMGCGLCKEACTPRAIELVWDFATLTRAENCNSCNTCAEVCPHEVIRMCWVKATGSPVVGKWSAQPPQPDAEVAKPKGWLWGLLTKEATG